MDRDFSRADPLACLLDLSASVSKNPADLAPVRPSAAVRDLFGSVHSEVASKGILVTTSGFGRASFDFAKDKPLELLSGSNLLYLLKAHADVDAKIEPLSTGKNPPLTPAPCTGMNLPLPEPPTPSAKNADVPMAPVPPADLRQQRRRQFPLCSWVSPSRELEGQLVLYPQHPGQFARPSPRRDWCHAH